MRPPEIQSRRSLHLFSSWFILAGICLSTSVALPQSRQPAEIEKEVLLLSRSLKPISDENWKTISGQQSAEKYTIVQGDTLYDISKRLFGDPNYWPKIWSLNNPTITNPHLIRPGNFITFLPGSGTQLPSVSVDSAQKTEQPETPETSKNNSPITKTPNSPRSQDWKDLPRQKWEALNVVIPEELEQVGMERDTKEKLRLAVSEVKLTLKAVAATNKIEPLGQIDASTTAAQHLATGDRVFIHALHGKLQIGQTYSITSEPGPLTSPRENLQGFCYSIMGSVVIQNLQNGVYIGKILTADHLVARNMHLIPAPPRIPLLEPAQGPDPMDAGIIMEPEFAAPMGFQFQQVFIDRGSHDGLTPGMTFGIYQKIDPHTQSPIQGRNIHKFAEIMIVQVSEKFSSAIIEKSDGPIYTRMIARLISDPAALEKEIRAMAPPDLPKTASHHSATNHIEGDDLDNLDKGSDELKENEKKELKQLENWKPPATAP